MSFGIWWEYKIALVETFRLAVKRVMSSPGDPKLLGVIWPAWDRECLTGKDITSQTPPWHRLLSMAETFVPNKDWFVSDYHYVCLNEPERVFMDVKSANVVMILGIEGECKSMVGRKREWLSD